MENRHHWRRDALVGEDGSRARQIILPANLAPICNALLSVLAEPLQTQPLPQLLEHLHSPPARCLALLANS